ncbi:hypothetical protein GP486_003839 [Trichoglossum hirsutum]|uniref:Glucosamine 6-phosphate N-acetyltransferase n=1 Tax=Trichoglossum hirsutum TaxID=265104 RepID=A0A9P8RQ38_9PEZI|nr:hypothetical protein GP486_003839 [Trichoglossum hirsutum]
MSSSPPLFPPSLIPATTTAQLPASYTMRPLEAGDYERGFLDVLRVLAPVGDVSGAAFRERFEWMRQRAGEYYLIVVVDGAAAVVGTGCLVVEKKL